MADADRVASITGTVSQEISKAVSLEGVTASAVTFAAREDVVQRLSAFVKIKSDNPQGMKIYLTSPSGTKVLLVDGSRSRAVKAGGLEGWFGQDGLPSAESLDAFVGESITGEWRLSVDSASKGELSKWSLTADLGSNTKMAGMETYGEYGGDGGCDCRVSDSGATAVSTALVFALLLGLALVRRRS